MHVFLAFLWNCSFRFVCGEFLLARVFPPGKTTTTTNQRSICLKRNCSPQFEGRFLPQNDIARLLIKLWWEHAEKSERACWFALNRELEVIPLLSSRWRDWGCHWLNGYKSTTTTPFSLATGWVASFWTISTMVALIRFNCYNWPNGQIDLRRACCLKTLTNLILQSSQTKKLLIAHNQAAKMIVLCIAEVSLGHRHTHF